MRRHPRLDHQPWDAIIGLDGIPLVAGETYAYRFFASATPSRVGRALIQLPVDPWTTVLRGQPRDERVGQLLRVHLHRRHPACRTPRSPSSSAAARTRGASASTTCRCRGGAEPEVYEPDTGPRVRVNQVAYLPKGPKNATVVTDATAAVGWQLKNAGGSVVASGDTTPHGVDASSGQNVHSIDFGSYVTPGEGYTLTADGETSRPFDIAPSAYAQLKLDALKFYYTQRSGIAIDDALRPGYGRPAGHIGVAPNQGDTSVPCQPGVCDYSLDVSGGWYDAGDHGKYVVNGGISVWQLMSEFERTKNAATAKRHRDSLAIPESGNAVPDILDEARWELEFLLKMQRARRHGAPQDPRRGLDRPAADAAPGPAAA